MIRGVAFDFDGTLADSNNIKQNAYFDILRSYDPEGDLTAAVLKANRGADRYELGMFLVEALEANDVIGAPSGAELGQSYTLYCHERIIACPEIAGATEALSALSAQGLFLAINTATPTDAMAAILEARGWINYFNKIVGSEESKPDTLAMILAELNLSPDELLFVGDSADDWEAARQIGCPFVGIVLREERRFNHIPAKIISDLHPLPTLITEWNG